MSLSIPIFDKDILGSGDGKYRATFIIKNWTIFDLAPIRAGKTYNIGDKKVSILDVIENRSENKLLVLYLISTVELGEAGSIVPTESKIGAGAILLGILVVGGLLSLNMILTKVEKVIDSPAGQATVIGGFVLIFIILILGVLSLFKRFK